MDVIIEVTRRCNAWCDHCLRGDPEQHTMKPNIRKQAIDLIHSLDGVNIGLTGGEPMLVPKICEEFFDELNHTCSFCEITTNGSIWNKSVERLVNKLTNAEYYIRVSHNQPGGNDTHKHWHFLAEVEQLVYLDDQGRRQPGSDHYISEGRGVDWGTRAPTFGNNLYINVFGQCFTSCDLSYWTQRNSKPICSIFDADAKDIIKATFPHEFEEEEVG